MEKSLRSSCNQFQVLFQSELSEEITQVLEWEQETLVEVLEQQWTWWHKQPRHRSSEIHPPLSWAESRKNFTKSSPPHFKRDKTTYFPYLLWLQAHFTFQVNPHPALLAHLFTVIHNIIMAFNRWWFGGRYVSYHSPSLKPIKLPSCHFMDSNGETRVFLNMVRCPTAGLIFTFQKSMTIFHTTLALCMVALWKWTFASKAFWVLLRFYKSSLILM